MQLIFLRAHLRMLAAGMKNSRLSGTAILKLVSAHTGRDYKRGQYARALADVQELLRN